MDVSVIATTAGSVDVARSQSAGRPVLFFPGGHCSATTDCGWGLYTRHGYQVISFSRPGYGATRVGQLNTEELAVVIGDVCARLGIETVAAAVGVSFGGMQARSGDVHTMNPPATSEVRTPGGGPSVVREAVRGGRPRGVVRGCLGDRGADEGAGLGPTITHWPRSGRRHLLVLG